MPDRRLKRYFLPITLRQTCLLTHPCYNITMNNTLRKILGIFVAILLLYLLVWPFINSAISHAYHIKTATEGYPGESYTSEFRPGYLSVAIAHYNNVATEKQAEEEAEFYESALDDDTFNKLEKIVDTYKSFHLFVRHHNGYGFFYDSTSGGAMFFNKQDKDELLQLNKILAKIVRGDEKYPDSRRQTYKSVGEKELDAFVHERGLD